MFEVGEKVKIKDNAYEIDGRGLGFASEMKKYCGGEYVIRAVDIGHFYKLENVFADEKDLDGYLMNGDGYWLWCDAWLEEAKPVNISNDELELMFQ